MTPTLGAEAHFAGALELMAATTMPFQAARTQLAYGAWLRRVALRAFDRLEAVHWSDQPRRELRPTGEQ